MKIVHKLSLDLLQPDTPARIQVKQGDALARSLEIQLFSGGEPWLIPANVIPLVRWSASDPESGAAVSGVYDSLPDGTHAWNYSHNQIDLLLVPQMFAFPGLVTADVALVQGSKVLSTFVFEFYVNRGAASGISPQIQSYYKIATLEQINTAMDDLQNWRQETDVLLADLEHHVYELNRIINGQ